MISVIERGTYEIIETKHRTKIIYINEEPYVWVSPKAIGEILVSSHRQKGSDTKLAAGRYILYDVDDEEYLTDLQHLELEYGIDAWQGYLLPTGLPHGTKQRARIIPTDQIITNNTYFKKHLSYFHPLTKMMGGA